MSGTIAPIPAFRAIHRIESGPGPGGVLSWHMALSSIFREAVEYRYSLQVTFASPQWQVLIGTALKNRPTLAPGQQIVKGWNEEETLKRAKSGSIT